MNSKRFEPRCFLLVLLLALPLSALSACQSTEEAISPAQSARGTIGPGGGALKVAGGPLAGAELLVPPEAVQEDTLFSLEGGDDVAYEDLVRVGPPLKLGPSGMHFDQSLAVTLPYRNQDLPEGQSPQDLVVLKRDDSSGEVAVLQPLFVDEDRQKVHFETLSFSTAQAAAGAGVCGDDRFETNDDWRSATHISPPSKLSRLKTCPANNDWYTFRIQPNTLSTVTLVNSDTDGSLGSVQLLDDMSQPIPSSTRTTTSSNGETRQVITVQSTSPIHQDIYFFVSLKSDQGTPGVSYTVEVTGQSTAAIPSGTCTDDSAEDDDDTAHANILTLPANLHGRMLCREDSDYFKVAVPPQVDLTVRVSWPDGEGKIYSLQLVDTQNRPLQDRSQSAGPDHQGRYVFERQFIHDSQGTDDVVFSLSLMEDTMTPGLQYDLSVTAAPIKPEDRVPTGPCQDDAMEDDDTPSDGTRLVLPARQTGRVACQNDTDWYRFQVHPGTTLTIEVSSPMDEGYLGDVRLVEPQYGNAVSFSNTRGSVLNGKRIRTVEFTSTYPTTELMTLAVDARADRNHPGIPYDIDLSVTGGTTQLTAVDDWLQLDEDSSLEIAPVDNDVVPYGTTAALRSVTAPLLGTVSVHGDSVTYTPVANASGQDSFQYTVLGSDGSTSTGTVHLTVMPLHDPPVAMDDTVSTNEDQPVEIRVQANDSNPDRRPLTVVVDSVTMGQASVTQDGGVLYTPVHDASGAVTLDYTLVDWQGARSSAHVDIQVDPVNDPPTAAQVTLSIDEDQPAQIDLAAQATDVDSLTLTLTAVGTPQHGVSVVDGATGVARYTPAANYHGPDHFIYTIADGDGGLGVGRVDLTVASINDAPVASDDSATLSAGRGVVLFVLANDVDADGDPLNVTITTDASHGQTAVNADGSVNYVPQTGFSGSDHFIYEIDDGHAARSSATVTLVVEPGNRPPLAVDDTVATDEEQPVDFDPRDNDSDPDGDMIWVGGLGQPAHGTVHLNDSGPAVTYIPNQDFSGTDSFSYSVTDGVGARATATVTVTVHPINDPPSAQDDTFSMLQDTVAVFDVLTNDSDPDMDPLTVQSIHQGPQGTATIVSRGWPWPDLVQFEPEPGVHGVFGFDYVVSDDSGETATASVTVTVQAPLPPNAADDHIDIDEDGSVTVDVLANDTGHGTLRVASVSPPGHGVAALQPDGRIRYRPLPDFHGADSFTYTLADDVDAEDEGRVTVDVTSVNDRPVARTDSVATEQSLAVESTVTDNDEDVDGDPITVTQVTAANHGMTEILGGGALRYTPEDGFVGEDWFAYTIEDGQGGQDSALVVVTVWDELPVVCDLTADLGSALMDDAAEASTLAAPSQSQGSCGGAGPELQYRWTAPAQGEYLFTVRDSPGVVIYARADHCEGPELDCSDTSWLRLTLEEGEAIALYLDTPDATPRDLSLGVARLSDGERCEDPGDEDGDGAADCADSECVQDPDCGGSNLESFEAIPWGQDAPQDVVFSWVVTGPGAPSCLLEYGDEGQDLIEDCQGDVQRVHTYAGDGAYVATLRVLQSDQVLSATATLGEPPSHISGQLQGYPDPGAEEMLELNVSGQWSYPFDVATIARDGSFAGDLPTAQTLGGNNDWSTDMTQPVTQALFNPAACTAVSSDVDNEAARILWIGQAGQMFIGTLDFAGWLGVRDTGFQVAQSELAPPSQLGLGRRMVDRIFSTEDVHITVEAVCGIDGTGIWSSDYDVTSLRVYYRLNLQAGYNFVWWHVAPLTAQGQEEARFTFATGDRLDEQIYLPADPSAPFTYPWSALGL